MTTTLKHTLASLALSLTATGAAAAGVQHYDEAMKASFFDQLGIPQPVEARHLRRQRRHDSQTDSGDVCNHMPLVCSLWVEVTSA